jgi:hypothetical protein
VVALLLWPERVAASGFTAPLNKFGAAGFFPLQIKAKLFLASRGGGGEELAADLLLPAGRGGEEEWKLWAASSLRGGGAAVAGVGGLVLCPAMVVR